MPSRDVDALDPQEFVETVPAALFIQSADPDPSERPCRIELCRAVDGPLGPPPLSDVRRPVHLGLTGQRDRRIRLSGKGIDVLVHTTRAGRQPVRADAQLTAGRSTSSVESVIETPICR